MQLSKMVYQVSLCTICCALFTTLLACGDNEPCLSGQEIVAIGIDGRPSLLAVRDATDEWVRLDADDDVDVCIRERYEVLSVCDYGGGEFVSELRASTAVEDSHVDAVSCHPGEFLSTITVTGRVQQAAHVWLSGANRGSSTGPWDFALLTSPGKHDLIVTNAYSGASSKLLYILRGLNITEDTTLAPLDLESQGLPLEEVALTIPDKRTGDAISTRVYWDTSNLPNTLAVVSQTQGPTAFVVPRELVRDTDNQFLEVAATSDQHARITTRRMTDDLSAPVELLPIVENAYFGADGLHTVRWGTIPVDEYGDLQFVMRQSAGGVRLQSLRASRGWLAATRSTYLDLDPHFGEHSSDWFVTTSQPHLRTFAINRTVDDQRMTSRFTLPGP